MSSGRLNLSSRFVSVQAVVRDWLRLDVGWNETGVASPVFRRLGVANNEADPTIFWAATLSP
jgi:hypothetical protein